VCLAAVVDGGCLVSTMLVQPDAATIGKELWMGVGLPLLWLLLLTCFLISVRRKQTCVFMHHRNPARASLKCS
jgi:hypothetical protein